MRLEANIFWSKPVAGQTYRPMPGDVILVGSRTKAFVNVAQTALRLRSPGYSHAALVLLPDLCVHSNPGRGVTLDRVDSVLANAGGAGHFRVFRPTGLRSGGDLDLADDLISSASVFFERRYNYWLFFPPSLRRYFGYKTVDDVYCSELIAVTYRRLRHPASSNPPSNTLPSDVLSFVSKSPGWSEVTWIYVNYLREGADDGVIDLRNECVRTDQRLLHRSLVIRHRRNKAAVAAAYVKAQQVVGAGFHRNRRPTAQQLATSYTELRAAYLLIRKLSLAGLSNEHHYRFGIRRQRLLRAAERLRRASGRQ